jgi:aryl-alcohol dehydrogenase-like predicted oxidoreductase
MRYLEINGERIPRIGLGTWQFGSREWGYGETYATADARRIVERALELGIDFFDTAEAYGNGRSEEILGAALAGRRAFLATKFLPMLPAPRTVYQHGIASRNRLDADRIDLYQLHWPPPHAPAAFTMTGMRRLAQEQVARLIGVSNHSLEAWQNADRVFGGPTFSNQVHFSLVRPEARQRLVPFARDNDRLVIAYSPLAQGYLSGRYDPDHRPTGMRAVNPVNPLSHPPNLVRAMPLIEALGEIGHKHDATTSQVALAWVISHPNTMAIPGARTVGQLEQNAAAVDLELDADDLARLEHLLGEIEIKRGVAALAETVRRGLSRVSFS